MRAAAALLAVSATVGVVIAARDATFKAPAPRICETAIVTSGPIAGTLRLPGRLSTESTVRIGSSQPGLVIAVAATLGARVKKGDVLARLDDAEQHAALAGASAQLASAELLALRAERELSDELQRRLGEGLLPESLDPDELLDGKAGDAQLEYLHGAAQISRHEHGVLLARKLLARRLVRAPIDGVVLARNIEPGESIPASPPGPPLFVIGSDPRRLRLEVELDERYLQAVSPGRASFVVPTYGPHEFAGTVRQLVPSATAARSPAPYVLLIEVDNPDGALQPGMSAIVDVAMVAARGSLSIPTAALSSRNDSTIAWLADDRGRPTEAPVTVGIANADFSEVQGPGIAAGRVVVNDIAPTTCLVAAPVPASGAVGP